MRADTRLPPYLPYPRFLLQTDLTQTAKLLYALLLDRATLSQANGWLDESGRIYLVFPIEKIAAALDRSTMTVKTALSELEDAGLIERRRSGFSKPNRIYVKLPPDGQKTFQTTDRNPSSIGTENCPTDGKKIVPMKMAQYQLFGTNATFGRSIRFPTRAVILQHFRPSWWKRACLPVVRRTVSFWTRFSAPARPPLLQSRWGGITSALS